MVGERQQGEGESASETSETTGILRGQNVRFSHLYDMQAKQDEDDGSDDEEEEEGGDTEEFISTYRPAGEFDTKQSSDENKQLISVFYL